MMGGVQETSQQTIETAFTFGEKLLHWIEDPGNWIPALLIIVGIAVWKGHPMIVRRRDGK